jgi:hypothetical protein
LQLEGVFRITSMYAPASQRRMPLLAVRARLRLPPGIASTAPASGQQIALGTTARACLPRSERS